MGEFIRFLEGNGVTLGGANRVTDRKTPNGSPDWQRIRRYQFYEGSVGATAAIGDAILLGTIAGAAAPEAALQVAVRFPKTTAFATYLIAGLAGVPVPSASIPRGFSSYGQYIDALNRFKVETLADDAVIGVRGSAATGMSHDGLRSFGPGSDIDFFVVSDKLVNQAMQLGARVKNGALRVGDTMKYFPQLHIVEKALTNELGRKVSIRIFSSEGFKKVILGSEIY